MTQNIALIREGLGARSTKLIAVTKFATASQIEEAFKTGVTEFGENRVQVALAKMESLPSYLVKGSSWHSVDSMDLAKEISRVSCEKNIVQPILLQVKMAFDPNKTGFDKDTLKKEFATIVHLPNIECRGLMAITPQSFSPQERIACFDGLRNLRDRLSAEYGIPLSELSMGMSDDWREAVSCGSTMIRVGSAIFRSDQKESKQPSAE